MSKSRFLTVIAMIFAAALSRLIPHPWNVTPLAAMALFSGAQFPKLTQAMIVPISAMFISDVILGFHKSMAFVYLSLIVIVLIGRVLKNHKGIGATFVASLSGSVVFFVLTNFNYWMSDALYPKTLQGLLQCYTMALPFFRNTLLGDLFYTAVLFGGFALLEKRVPKLKEAKAAQ